MSLKVKEAKEELKEKSYLEIQAETAWKWASRAAASYEMSEEEKELSRKVGIFQIAEEYRHEAVEHASLYEDSGVLLKQVEDELNNYRDKAATNLHEELSK